MKTLELPTTNEEIRAETKRIGREIKEHQAAVKMLVTHLRLIQDQCDHKGQETGFNERDGSWANPCPTCGEYH